MHRSLPDTLKPLKSAASDKSSLSGLAYRTKLATLLSLITLYSTVVLAKDFQASYQSAIKVAASSTPYSAEIVGAYYDRGSDGDDDLHLMIKPDLSGWYDYLMSFRPLIPAPSPYFVTLSLAEISRAERPYLKVLPKIGDNRFTPVIPGSSSTLSDSQPLESTFYGRLLLEMTRNSVELTALEGRNYSFPVPNHAVTAFHYEAITKKINVLGRNYFQYAVIAASPSREDARIWTLAGRSPHRRMAVYFSNGQQSQLLQEVFYQMSHYDFTKAARKSFQITGRRINSIAAINNHYILVLEETTKRLANDENQYTTRVVLVDLESADILPLNSPLTFDEIKQMKPMNGVVIFDSQNSKEQVKVQSMSGIKLESISFSAIAGKPLQVNDKEILFNLISKQGPGPDRAVVILNFVVLLPEGDDWSQYSYLEE